MKIFPIYEKYKTPASSATTKILLHIASTLENAKTFCVNYPSITGKKQEGVWFWTVISEQTLDKDVTINDIIFFNDKGKEIKEQPINGYKKYELCRYNKSTGEHAGNWKLTLSEEDVHRIFMSVCQFDREAYEIENRIAEIEQNANHVMSLEEFDYFLEAE